jgi:hypothetical protein
VTTVDESIIVEDVSDGEDEDEAVDATVATPASWGAIDAPTDNGLHVIAVHEPVLPFLGGMPEAPPLGER